MESKYSIGLEMVFGASDLPLRIARIAEPEEKVSFTKRASASITSNKDVLTLKISANDRAALKASFNSYFKLISLCCDLKEGLND